MAPLIGGATLLTATHKPNHVRGIRREEHALSFHVSHVQYSICSDLADEHYDQTLWIYKLRDHAAGETEARISQRLYHTNRVEHFCRHAWSSETYTGMYTCCGKS
jgi:hypothetical protein